MNDKITADQEAMVAMYFQMHGYLVRRGLKVALEETQLDATDIDVFAIRYSNPCWEESLIVDCKDRRKPKPFERILWTAGLRDVCRATRGIIVLPHAPWQAFAFAKENRLEILPNNLITEFLEARHEFIPFSSADHGMTQFEFASRNQLNEGERYLLRHNLKLHSLLLSGHPLTNFNQVINMVNELGHQRVRHHVAFNWYFRFVCFNAAVVASVMLLRFVSEIKWLPEKDWTDYARKKLTYGDIPPQKAQQLVELAYRTGFHDGLPAPKYLEEVIGLLGGLLTSQSASKIPYFLDYYLLGKKLGNKINIQLDEQLASDTELQRLLKQIISVISYAADFSPKFWEETWVVDEHGMSRVPTAESSKSRPNSEYSQSSNEQELPVKQLKIEVAKAED